MRTPIFPVVLTCLLGCGGGTTIPTRADAGSVDGSVTGDGAVTLDGGPTGDGGRTGDGGLFVDAGGGPCPLAAPAPNGACPRVGLICEYGSDPRGDQCRTVATCGAAGWAVVPDTCAPPPGTTCPPTLADAQGNACSPMDAYCSYPDALACHCTNCTTGPSVMCSGPTVWHCDAPNPDAQCPPAMPNLGEACAPEAKLCTYTCGAAGARQCTGGVWIAHSGGPCPVSTRRAKQDIQYLGPADLSQVAAELAKFRLATYRYKDPALAAGRHLGFILEDVPGSPAVNAEHNMVDLYGYTSMLVAAVQTQSREVEALRREVAELKRLLRAKRR